MQVQHSNGSFASINSAPIAGASVTQPGRPPEDTLAPAAPRGVAVTENGAPAPAAAYALPQDPERGHRHRNRSFIARHACTITTVAVLAALTVGLAVGLTHDHRTSSKTEPVLNPSAVPSSTMSTVSWAIPTSASMTATPTAVHPTATPTASVLPLPLPNPTVEPQAGAGDSPLQPFDVALFPAGLPTVGDVNGHGVPDNDARQQIRDLAFHYPRYLQSLVALQTNTTFDVSAFSPNGTPVTVGVDNTFIAHANGSLAQTGSKGGNANWASVLEKGMAKWMTFFAPSNGSNYGLVNATAGDVLRIFTPHGTLANLTATPLRTSIGAALHALNVTFKALPQNQTETLAPLFKSALCKAEAGDAQGLRQDVSAFTDQVQKSNRSAVAAYDNLVSGLDGVAAWVDAVAKA